MQHFVYYLHNTIVILYFEGENTTGVAPMPKNSNAKQNTPLLGLWQLCIITIGLLGMILGVTQCITLKKNESTKLRKLRTQFVLHLLSTRLLSARLMSARLLSWQLALCFDDLNEHRIQCIGKCKVFRTKWRF